MLAIRSLTLHHFRNYHHIALETGGRSAILTGPNGAGKTNVLEAVSLLLPGRGLRKAKLNAMRREASAAPWVIAADIDGLHGSVQLGTALDVDAANDRRLTHIDGEKAKSQTVLAEHLAISWHTPQMDGLFLASDGERRRYLDRLIFGFDGAHLTRVNRYEQAMRERNRLLTEGGVEPAWLSALEQTMAETAASIATARLEGLERLNHAMDTGAAFPCAQLSIEGEVETLLADQAASDAEAQIASSLQTGRGRDAAAGRALFGVHRSRLCAVHKAKDAPAEQCSTGEQKALLIAIMLAHARARKDWLGEAPILLLDETVAHLDAARRKALADTLEALETQIWMTGTDAADFEAFERFAAHFSVSDGATEKRP